jgi:hypothetical protein
MVRGNQKAAKHKASNRATEVTARRLRRIHARASAMWHIGEQSGGYTYGPLKESLEMREE